MGVKISFCLKYFFFAFLAFPGDGQSFLTNMTTAICIINEIELIDVVDAIYLRTDMQ